MAIGQTPALSVVSAERALLQPSIPRRAPERGARLHARRVLARQRGAVRCFVGQQFRPYRAREGRGRLAVHALCESGARARAHARAHAHACAHTYTCAHAWVCRRAPVFGSHGCTALARVVLSGCVHVWFPQPPIVFERRQAQVPKQQFQSASPQARVPERKFTIYKFLLKVVKRKFPGEHSETQATKRKFPSQSSQMNVPKRKSQREGSQAESLKQAIASERL